MLFLKETKKKIKTHIKTGVCVSVCVRAHLSLCVSVSMYVRTIVCSSINRNIDGYDTPAVKDNIQINYCFALTAKSKTHILDSYLKDTI